MDIKLKLENIKKLRNKIDMDVRTLNSTINVIDSFVNDFDVDLSQINKKIIELKEELNSNVYEYLDEKTTILSLIHSLNNIREENVLIYRYIEELSWQDIADKMDLAVITLYKIHSKAIEHLVRLK